MAAVVYHIRQYTLPEKHLPRLVTTAFIFVFAFVVFFQEDCLVDITIEFCYNVFSA